MRIIHPDTVLKPFDLVVPNGWSGNLNRIYPCNGLDCPWTYFNYEGAGKTLDKYPNYWIWRHPNLPLVKIDINSPLQFGDLIERVDEVCGFSDLGNLNLSDFCLKAKSGFIVNGISTGITMDIVFSKLSHYQISRLSYPNEDSVGDSDSIRLADGDYLTIPSFTGDPFTSGCRVNINHLSFSFSGLPLAAARSHYERAMIGWRRFVKKNNWVQLSNSVYSRTDDIIVPIDFTGDLNLVINKTMAGIRFGVKISSPDSCLAGLTTDGMQPFFDTKIKVMRNLNFISPITDLKIFEKKRVSSKGNILYSKALPIP